MCVLWDYLSLPGEDGAAVAFAHGVDVWVDCLPGQCGAALAESRSAYEREEQAAAGGPERRWLPTATPGAAESVGNSLRFGMEFDLLQREIPFSQERISPKSTSTHLYSTMTPRTCCDCRSCSVYTIHEYLQALID